MKRKQNDAELLRTLRVNCKLSITRCCELTDTPYRTWQNWENEISRVPGIAIAFLRLYRKAQCIVE